MKLAQTVFLKQSFFEQHKDHKEILINKTGPLTTTRCPTRSPWKFDKGSSLVPSPLIIIPSTFL